MSDIKLIAIDIDGTLLNSQHVVTDRVKKALQQAKERGIKVVLCTGRPLRGVEELLLELGLSGDDNYVITSNGALVQSIEGRVIASYAMSPEHMSLVKKIADEHHTYHHFANKDAIYTTNRDIGTYTVHEASLVRMPLKVRTLEELIDSGLEIQKAMIVDEPERLNEIMSVLPKSFLNQFGIVKSAPFYLEILNKGANKGSGVTRLCNHLGFDLADVMAIGDNDNDIDMLSVVGHSVAMGNARSHIQAMSRYVTTTNDEDGVARIIEEVVLSL